MKVHLFGVSTDTAESHKKLKKKYDLPFPLLVDDKHVLSEKYGAWREKNMYGKKSMGVQRATFLIGSDGKLKEIWPKVKVDGHVEEVTETLKNLK